MSGYHCPVVENIGKSVVKTTDPFSSAVVATLFISLSTCEQMVQTPGHFKEFLSTRGTR